jgi:hypothetical protein
LTLNLAYDVEDDPLSSRSKLSADIAIAIAEVAEISEGLESGRTPATPLTVRRLEQATAALESLVAQLP